MTNSAIILEHKLLLYKEGKLKGTGRMLCYTDNEGMEHEMPEIEDIHTYARWKELGFVVRRGEKAIAKFPIWKYTSRTIETDDGDEKENASMWMKNSAFFSASQVDPLDESEVA